MAEARDPHESENAGPSETGQDQSTFDARSEVERGMAILIAIEVVVLLLTFGPAFLGSYKPTLVETVIVVAVLALLWTGRQWAIVVAACFFGLGIVGSIVVGAHAATDLGAGVFGFLLGAAGASLYGGCLFYLIYSKTLNAFLQSQRGEKDTEEPSPSDPQHSTGKLTIVYAARTMQEAHLLRNLLEERGIRAIVTNAVLEGGAGVDVLGWATLARVAVNEENAIAARQIALEFDGSIRSQAAAEAGPEVVASAERAVDAAARTETDVRLELVPESWPRCPRCGAPRMTRCPACGTSGSGFPLADRIGAEPTDASAAAPLLLCIECDEPFTPEYAHDCEWCGHEFPDGFRPAAPVQSDDFSPGLLAVIGVTLAVVIGLLVYFAILLQSAGTR